MSPSDQPDVVARAEAFARHWHDGILDKGGRPYIDHPARVAARVAPYGATAVAAAWLHDVVEDANRFDERTTFDDLRDRGFPDDVVVAVDALTKREDEEHEDSVRRAAADPVGLLVKAADVADNSDPARLALVEDAKRETLTVKYDHARAVLDELGAPRFASTVEL